ncbi:hypothetical protein H2248_001637 [Termitomyces sp. 'cryptogamus']|nr:hypothetical protein H2248_001637 [Termitomyces sp. 'cryptogamus']
MRAHSWSPERETVLTSRVTTEKAAIIKRIVDEVGRYNSPEVYDFLPDVCRDVHAISEKLVERGHAGLAETVELGEKINTATKALMV